MRAWQGVVFDLVREEGASKRTTARLASLGVNGAGLTVMLAVFAHTGGLTGAEVVVAGGTSAVGQKVLEAIFGDQAVRALAARAREDLRRAGRRLLRRDAERFDALLDAAAPEADSFARLHAAVDAIRRAAMTDELDARLAALAEAADLADGRLEEPAVEAARAVVAKAGARLGLGLETTVVALAGPTGAGKSRLFNALTGTELAAVGRRRPTTPPARRRSGATAPTRCSTGSRSGAGTASTAATSKGSSCSTSRTSTRSRRRTGSRSTAWSGSPTSSSGSSSRRSTPMRRCTTATCDRSRRTPPRWPSS